MTARQCYEQIGADYNDVLNRLGREALIAKFIKKFSDDKSFSQFEEALAAVDYETAFRAIHTLKGVAANLSLSRLYQAASAMTEDIRGGVQPTHPELIDAVRREYEATVACIAQVD